MIRRLKEAYPSRWISAKIRLEDTVEDNVKTLRGFNETGMDFLTVHCRHGTLANSKSQQEEPDYQMLFEALDQINPVKIKIIVNGGIKSFADGEEMIAQGQSVAGTMIGVGLIDNPALLQWTIGPNGPVGKYQMTQSEYDGL